MEEKINEAQVEELSKDSVSEEDNNKKGWRSDYLVEAILFLVLGILIGFALKTEAIKKITIGFDDYKMKIFQKGYDINQLEKEAIQKRIEEANQINQDGNQDEAAAQANTQEVTGGSCQ